MLEFIKCSVSELDVLVDLAKSTFIEAFEKDNNPEDFQKYIKEAFNPKLIRDQLLNDDSRFYLVYNANTLVGYIKINKNRAQTDIKKTDYVELERIYVKLEYQSLKYGRLMLKKAI